MWALTSYALHFPRDSNTNFDNEANSSLEMFLVYSMGDSKELKANSTRGQW